MNRVSLLPSLVCRQLGIAVGFVTPPMIVKNHDSLDLIGNDLKFLFTSVAAFTTLLVVLVLICESPQKPIFYRNF
jgi:hypothetical protein